MLHCRHSALRAKSRHSGRFWTHWNCDTVDFAKGRTMKLRRRTFLHLAAAAVALPAVSRVATAQVYPSRPITMVVPYAPGGNTDVNARVVAQQMRGPLGQPVIIENVSGADGTIGTGRVVRARPDGYTIEVGGTSTHMLNGALYSLPYDVVNDFAPISLLFTSPYALFARKTMPAKDLNDLIAWLKANPKKASAGISGSSFRLITALFQKETGTQLTLVPYRGGAPALQDLVAGHIDLLFMNLDVLPVVRAGSIRAYAVASDMRSALAPDIPAFGEMGLPLSFSGFSWQGLLAPKGTPKEIIDRLKVAVVQGLADPAMPARLAKVGYEIFPRDQQTPEAVGALQKAQIEKWWPLVKELGIKAE
jgi:tripartite-type tricarboxylate transporter receptor subunit TctC